MQFEFYYSITGKEADGSPFNTEGFIFVDSAEGDAEARQIAVKELKRRYRFLPEYEFQMNGTDSFENS